MVHWTLGGTSPNGMPMSGPPSGRLRPCAGWAIIVFVAIRSTPARSIRRRAISSDSSKGDPEASSTACNPVALPHGADRRDGRVHVGRLARHDDTPRLTGQGSSWGVSGREAGGVCVPFAPRPVSGPPGPRRRRERPWRTSQAQAMLAIPLPLPTGTTTLVSSQRSSPGPSGTNKPSPNRSMPNVEIALRASSERRNSANLRASPRGRRGASRG